MNKKRANRKRVVKEKDKIKLSKKKSKIHPKKTKNTEKILIENFVSLQKVMVNLSIKFENLTHQISKLLDLFEISAKALAEKDFDVEKSNRGNMEILGKIDSILEQNKTIARGVTLMHDRINEPSNYPKKMPMPKSPPLQKFPLRHTQNTPMMRRAPEEYHEPSPSNEQ